MNTECMELKSYDEIVSKLRTVLHRLQDNLIGDSLLWI